MNFWLQLTIDLKSKFNNMEFNEPVFLGCLKNKRLILNDLKFSQNQDGFFLKHQDNIMLLQSGDVLEVGDFVITVSISKQHNGDFNNSELLCATQAFPYFEPNEICVQDPDSTRLAEHSLHFLKKSFSAMPAVGPHMNPVELTLDVQDYLGASDYGAIEQKCIEPVQKKRVSFLNYIKQKF